MTIPPIAPTAAAFASAAQTLEPDSRAPRNP
jgi:hypothetical protein